MKIQLDKPLENSPGQTFPIGAVIAVDARDGERLIEQGIGHEVPEHIPDTIDPEATMRDANERRAQADIFKPAKAKKKKEAPEAE
jgi:hypothetical protein